MPKDQDPVHLITAIGKGNYRPVTYSLLNQGYSTKFASVALVHLLNLSGARASILATEAVADSEGLKQLVAELGQAGVSAHTIRTNDGSSPGDFLATLHQLIELVREKECVILDVSSGLRHLPFAYLAALTYLTSFKDVKIGGIYNGAYEQKMTNANGVDVAPIHDLRVLFEATQWHHAVRAASESGDLRPLERAVEGERNAEGKRRQGRSTLAGLSNPLRGLSGSLAAGLPLESGLCAREMLGALRTSNAGEHQATLARLSLQPFESLLDDIATPEGVTRRETIALDEGELRRQLRLIRWYAERGNVQEALLLLREWLVSRAHLQIGDTSSWLGRKQRKAAERALGAAAARSKRTNVKKSASGSLWERVSTARNGLAHAGMDVQVKLKSTQEVQGWVRDCEALICAPLDLAPPGTDRILLSPLGFTPGVLFTAASSQKPDQVVVIASEQTERLAQQALAAAGMGDVPLETRVIKDPYGGVEEAKEIATTLRDKLAEARELVVNLTGGTTAMQLIVEKMAAEANRLGIPVRRILLIDRRPPHEQRDDPYVLGEVIELPDPCAGDPG